MRVWVNPDKMATLGLTATDVSRGDSGAEPAECRRARSASRRSPTGTDFQYPVNATGRLLEPRAVRRHRPARASPTARCCASATSAASSWARRTTRATRASTASRRPWSSSFLSPGANAVETGERVRTFLDEAKARRSRPASNTASATTPPGSCDAAITEVVAHAVRGDRAGHPRRLRLPPELARDADSAADRAGVDHRHVRAVPAARLLDQHDQHVRPRAGHRHRRRRRDRGGRGGAAQDRPGHEPRKDATIQAMEEVSGPVVAIAFILAAVFIPVALPRRHLRPDLPAVRADHRGLGAALGVQRAVAEPGAERADAAAARRETARRARAAVRRSSTAPSSGPPTRYISGVRLLVRRSVLALVALARLLPRRRWPVQRAARRLPARRGPGRGLRRRSPARRRVARAHASR